MAKAPACHTAKPSKGEAAKAKAEQTKMMTPEQWERSSTDAKHLAPNNTKAKKG